jgi:F0F1-type ATP synthase assembly protein I
MQSFLDRWPLLIAALWWGGLSALSFVAVPMAFAVIGNPALAGPYAAQLFQVQAWASLVIALVILMWGRLQRLKSAEVTARWVLLPWLLLAALAALVQEHGVAERILTARSTGADLRLWHTLGSVLVLLQWLCALRVLWWFAQRTQTPSATPN